MQDFDLSKPRLGDSPFGDSFAQGKSNAALRKQNESALTQLVEKGFITEEQKAKIGGCAPERAEFQIKKLQELGSKSSPEQYDQIDGEAGNWYFQSQGKNLHIDDARSIDGGILPQTIKLDEVPLPKDSEWNDQKGAYNCYAYAISGTACSPKNTLPIIPGAAGGKSVDGFHRKSVSDALVQDGLIPAVSKHSQLPPHKEGYYLIAAVADNRNGVRGDYHFYRQDDNGAWSHKANNCSVSRLDASGNAITNPELADRDYRKTLINEYKWNRNYTDFVGYFYVPEQGIEMKIPIIGKHTHEPQSPIKGAKLPRDQQPGLPS